MRYQAALPFLAATTAVNAVKLSLNSDLITSSQPFTDAFVSFSIEFSSFPDFAGEPLTERIHCTNLKRAC